MGGIIAPGAAAAASTTKLTNATGTGGPFQGVLVDDSPGGGKGGAAKTLQLIDGQLVLPDRRGPVVVIDDRDVIVNVPRNP